MESNLDDTWEWCAVQRRGPHHGGDNARRRERVWQWSGRLRWKWRQQRMVGVVCRGLRCSDMRTCARRREGGSGRRGGGSSREVEVVSGGGGGSSRGGVPMAAAAEGEVGLAGYTRCGERPQ